MPLYKIDCIKKYRIWGAGEHYNYIHYTVYVSAKSQLKAEKKLLKKLKKETTDGILLQNSIPEEISGGIEIINGEV